MIESSPVTVFFSFSRHFSWDDSDMAGNLLLKNIYWPFADNILLLLLTSNSPLLSTKQCLQLCLLREKKWLFKKKKISTKELWKKPRNTKRKKRELGILAIPRLKLSKKGGEAASAPAFMHISQKVQPDRTYQQIWASNFADQWILQLKKKLKKSRSWQILRL